MTTSKEPIGILIRRGLRLLVEKLFSRNKSNRKANKAGADLLEDVSINEGVRSRIRKIKITSVLTLLGANKENI